MQVQFHGAARTVTGSRHIIRINGMNLLLDCGLFQGRRKETYKRNLNFSFDPTSIDGVVLSHAHIDHSGNIPNLVQQGYEGPIHATEATVHLTDIMLRDSGHIQEDDANWLNRKRRKAGEPEIEPLYTAAQAAQAHRQFVSQRYDHPFEPLPGVQVRLVEAGHILGSASMMCDLEEKGRRVRLMFSGDIGRPGMALLRDPVLPDDVDYLLLECTYGDRIHNTPQEAYEDLQEIVSQTAGRSGKVIVPAFAVGRTQTLVYYLHQMMDRGEIPRIPIFVDSPLAINVTAIFREYPEYYDRETQKFLRGDQHNTPFDFNMVKYTLTVEESKSINNYDGPAVIISASGMAEVGRILHHLKNNIEEERNTILINSWMAPHTLGRRLVEGEKRVKIFGEKYTVNAEVVKINGLSAHADQHHLLEYARAVRDRVKRIFLVHGEEGPARSLQGLLEQDGFQVGYPKQGQRFELE